MLVYPQAGDHRIWMKNMRIALRVYWIDEHFTVIGAQRLEPCRVIVVPNLRGGSAVALRA